MQQMNSVLRQGGGVWQNLYSRMAHQPARFLGSLLLLLSLLPTAVLWTGAAVAAAEAEGTGITVAEARAQLAQGRVAAKVRGQVTFSNPRLGIAFVQDGTDGIAFDPRVEAGGHVPRLGEWVEVEGELTRRQGLMMILRDRKLHGAPKVALVPAGGERVKPLRFELDTAAQMQIDGLLTRVSGVVRRVFVPAIPAAPMVVEISTPSGYAVARLPWRAPKVELDRWLNAVVNLHAVLVSQAEPPLLPEDACALLLVPGRSEWSVETGMLDEVFHRPPATSASGIQATPRQTARQRLHLTGVVTAARPLHWVTLRLLDGSVEVATRQSDVFEPGERLSVAGWPMNKNGRLLLQDGVCRRLGREEPPAPVMLEQGYFTAARHMELVTVEGRLHRPAIPGTAPRLSVLMPSGHHCLVRWDTFLRSSDVEGLEDDSEVRMTGIFQGWQELRGPAEGASFSLVPRTLADVRVIRGPSWWTPERLKLAVWWLLGITVLALPVAGVFRWQLWRQSLHIREIEGRAAAEEERRRIAREFHDSLQQQLAGTALHLETLRGALTAAPEMVPRLIEDTTAMVRHCQTEARHCIWDLRSEVCTHENLSESLASWLRGRTAAGGHEREVEATEVVYQGPASLPDLPPDTPFHLMRIAQEAVNNALAHAHAGKVSVRLSADARALHLVVEDDGGGFDLSLIARPRPGHYGLSSLRERAAKIGARLDISSQTGRGTRVSLHLPLLNRTKSHEPTR